MALGGSADRTRVDLVAECIWRAGERVSVPPKAFSVLRHLMERPEQLVTKAELLDAVWPQTYVIDAVLYIAVGELRQALGDDSKKPRFIATVHRRGFRWIGPPPFQAAGPVEDDTTPFVGRADSLAEIEACLALAHAGRRQVVFVTGEPGIGKTTLVDHFLRVSGAGSQVPGNPPTPNPRHPAPALLARGQCVDGYGSGEVYRPLLDAVACLLRGGAAEMRAIFRKHAPSWLLQMRDILDADELEELQRTVPSATIEWMQRELEQALEAAGAERTLILALEDLHWSDASTVSLLGALAARRGRARLLILGTYRPYDAISAGHPIVRLKHELVGKRQCVELALGGLSSAAVGEYFDQRFVPHRLSPTLASRLHAQTSGNPLFLLNALADFEQRGWLYLSDGEWECGVDVDTLGRSVPDGTRDLIAFRLELLPPATLDVLEAASLAGMSFTTQAVAAATERSNDDVEAECRRLTQTLFLQPGEDVEWPDGSRGRQYKLRHSLYRQVLDNRVSPSRRQLLHRRIAERMERAYGKRVAEIAGPLSFHYEHAGDAFRAVDFIEILVQQTYARRAVDEAMMLYDRAVTLLQRLPDSEAQQRRLIEVNAALGLFSSTTVGFGHAVSARAIAGMRSLSQSPPTAMQDMPLLVAVVGGHLIAGEFTEGLRVGQMILANEGNGASLDTLLAGHAAIGMSLFYLGEITAALSHLERVAVLAASVPPLTGGDGSLVSIYDAAVPSLYTLAYARTLAGAAEPGSTAIDAALARARMIEMPWYVASTLVTASVIGVYRRDLDVVRRWASESQVYCGNGQPLMQAMARFLFAWAELIETRDPALIEPLRAAHAETEPEGNPLARPRTFGMLAAAHLHLGQLEMATKALDDAFAGRGEARYYDVELYRQRAAIVRARSKGKRPRAADLKESAALLETAIDLATQQGTQLLGLRATVDLCRLPLTTDKRDEARQQLAQRLTGFPRNLDDVDLREARQLLDTI